MKTVRRGSAWVRPEPPQGRPGPDLRADVCVVGAGPAGLALAHELAASRLDVLVLEAGPARPPAAGVDVTTTANVGLPYDPAATRSAGVGGSSLRWSVGTPLGPGFVRLKELDDDELAPSGTTATGWPFGRDELAPHYRRARQLVGLGPDDGGQDTAVGGGLERRVYSFARRTVFTEDLPAVLRRHPRVRLLAGCTVTDVRTDDADAVTSLRARLEDGTDLAVTARAYVLAGGAIENARLLLASRSRHAAGLGNGHDLVGRYFMEHPHYHSGVLRPGSGDLSAGAARWDVVLRSGQVRQDKYTLAPAVRRSHGVLGAAYKVKPFTAASLPFGHDGTVAQDVLDAWTALRHRHSTRDGLPAAALRHPVPLAPALAPALVRHAARQGVGALGAALGRPVPPVRGHRVLVMAEQEPSPLSRLRLTGGVDRFGVPLAELDWRLSALDLRSMAVGQRLVAGPLGAAVGATVVSTVGPDGVGEPEGGAHHMGTTRMSRSPRTGVVDERCRVHGVPNLYLAGSSVFPTAGAANPTLTIVALAVRLAAHLRDELGAGVGLGGAGLSGAGRSRADRLHP